MRVFFTLVVLCGVAPMAHAEDCKPVSAPDADESYQLVGVRRPVVLDEKGKRLARVDVEVELPVTTARNGDDSVEEVFDCSGKKKFFPLVYKVLVTSNSEYDMTEILLPKDLAIGAKFRSRSRIGGEFTGTYEGPKKWVNLVQVGGKAGLAATKYE